VSHPRPSSSAAYQYDTNMAQDDVLWVMMNSRKKLCEDVYMDVTDRRSVETPTRQGYSVHVEGAPVEGGGLPRWPLARSLLPTTFCRTSGRRHSFDILGT
jgi:hypothetical protein